MESDQLDTLLKDSAPSVRALSTETIRGMVAEARGEIGRPNRRRRAIVLSSALGALLISGTGIAVANDLFPWTADQQDPFVRVEYRLPSGLQCEQRLYSVDAVNPEASIWLRSFAAENDLGALADVDGYLDRMESWGESTEGDAAYWSAVNGALWETLLTEAADAGFGSSAFSGGQYQTYCVDADGNVAFPR